MTDYRTACRTSLHTLLACPERELDAVAADILADDAVFDVAAPLNRLEGRQHILDMFYRPLRSALGHCHRRDDIFLGGQNRRAAGETWLAATTHYVGQHQAPFCGIRAMHGETQLVLLRAGEFYRLTDGRISEAKILFDLPDLMMQAGSSPFGFSYGAEILFPAPATHDGVCPDPPGGEASLDVVEKMAGGLRSFDPQTFASAGQTGEHGCWHDDMLWYGPAGIGSNYRWDGFVACHRKPFLEAFPDRIGGNHYCRISDGSYAAVSGWPSMTMTFQHDYLGAKADGRALTLRVMDFYRIAAGKIAENWVYLDLVDLMHQMDVDVLARQHEPA